MNEFKKIEIPDPDSWLRKVLKDFLHGKYPWLKLVGLVYFTAVNMLLWGSTLLLFKPSLQEFVWISSATQMIFDMTVYEVFDQYFWFCGSYASLISFYIWVMIYTENRQWILFMLQFEENLLAYRDSLYTDEYIKQSMKERAPMLTVFPLKFSLPIFQFYLLGRDRAALVDMAKFRKNRCKLKLFSTVTLSRTAVLSDLTKMIANICTLFYTGGIILILLFLYYKGFRDPFGLLMFFVLLPYALYSILELVIVGLIYELYALVFHMLEVNTFLKLYSSSSRMGALKRFLLWHATTSVFIDKTNCSIFLFIWFYTLIPVNAYLMFRFLNLSSNFIVGLTTLVFWAVDTIAIFVSFFIFIFIYKSFYKNKNRFPKIIFHSTAGTDLRWKWKFGGFYEQQTSKKCKSGFKIAPNMIINSNTFAKFMMFYLAMNVEIFQFFSLRKSKIDKISILT